MEDQYVELEHQSGIATITFYTPDHNALPLSILNELKDKIEEAGGLDEVKVIVLKSGGDRTFCAGASFKELIAIENDADGEKFFMGFANVILAMRSCPKLIIGRVQGKAVGGGVGLAAATDYCFATKYAAIKLSEISIGIGPFVIGPALERKIGVSAFSQMTINAKGFYDPQWAKENGLYAEVYENIAEMDMGIQTLTNNLITYNPEALKASKTVFWEGTESWPALLQERAKMSGSLVLSEFTKKTLQGYD
tara:strand:- start:27342 stop:28094 length:753 start_codon:yes stop_codon:yes gene_type:complete